jgi:hypothetical protein
MTHQHNNFEANKSLLQKAYIAFNARDIDGALQQMHTTVRWPNGWEGGFVQGHEAVRDYWQRQWKAIDPNVEPLSFDLLPDGRIAVAVRQLVKDLEGKVVADSTVIHVYTIGNGLVQTMEIE